MNKNKYDKYGKVKLRNLKPGMLLKVLKEDDNSKVDRVILVFRIEGNDKLIAYQFFKKNDHYNDKVGIHTFSAYAYETLDNIVEIKPKKKNK